jgi:hypothetical protein
MKGLTRLRCEYRIVSSLYSSVSPAGPLHSHLQTAERSGNLLIGIPGGSREIYMSGHSHSDTVI